MYYVKTLPHNLAISFFTLGGTQTAFIPCPSPPSPWALSRPHLCRAGDISHPEWTQYQISSIEFLVAVQHSCFAYILILGPLFFGQDNLLATELYRSDHSELTFVNQVLRQTSQCFLHDGSFLQNIIVQQSWKSHHWASSQAGCRELENTGEFIFFLISLPYWLKPVRFQAHFLKLLPEIQIRRYVRMSHYKPFLMKITVIVWGIDFYISDFICHKIYRRWSFCERHPQPYPIMWLSSGSAE